MKKYSVSYSCFITVEIDAGDENQAMRLADLTLESLTGADFRENTDFDNIQEVLND
jgi:hypothetical protein